MTVSANQEKRRRIESKRAFTPARIVALALITLAVLALGYLRFAPDDSVSVPSGAQAGDLTLESCEYATEGGRYAADCGTLVVPENRADPESRLIALPVTRIRATSDDPKEPVFRLEGGPGITNMTFPAANRLAEEHDIVLVGYRGVDGSVRLDCPEVVSAMKRSGDFLAEKSLRARADGFRDCADRLQADGVDLAGYTLAQRVDDLEAARRALGYDRIDLVSESLGTRIAMIYSWRYPGSIHRSVMIAVNPPGHFLWDPQTADEQLRRYADLCAEDASCSGRTDDLVASLTQTEIPDRWLFLPIEEGNVRAASFFGLMESTSEAAPLSGPMTLDTWLSAAKGDSSGLWFQSLGAEMGFPEEQVWGDVAAIGRADARAAERYFSAGGPHRSDSNPAHAGNKLIWAGGRLLDAWPANGSESQYTRVRRSNVETLLIGGTLDFATPPKAASEELVPQLPNGHQVVLAELGHTTDFWTYQPKASSRLIGTFFDSGKVDGSGYEPAKIDFTPSVGQPLIAKIVVGSLAGLALVTVLSLLLMARRFRRRGGYGRKSSAILRSVYPFVLGVGGWSLGALIVLTTLPRVPLDDELLAVLSVGVPVGLGIYWAWFRGESSAGTKLAGFAAAAAGVLAGAWLGFHATSGLAALLTAVVGATAGANLTLLVLDISRDRRARACVAAARESLGARPSTG